MNVFVRAHVFVFMHNEFINIHINSIINYLKFNN